MPATRKLTLKPVQYDIEANNVVIASAYRIRGGNWNFHDLENDWWEESQRQLEIDQLIEVFTEIRKRRGRIKRALARKGK